MTNIYFPNKIELLGENFKIKEVSEHNIACQTCDDECMGKLEWDDRIIYVAIDNKDNTPQEILLHELGHYFAYYYHLGKSEIIADAFANFVKLLVRQLDLK